MFEPYATERASAFRGPVSKELERLSDHYGFVAIDNVVFTRGMISVVVDHVLVDRYGLLIIDDEDRTGSYITGADADKEWTAVFSAGQTSRFGNPLYLNVGNENVVRQALADASVTLDSSQLRSAVVFIGADLSKLTLVEVNAMKVVGVEHVGDVLEARYNFPPNNGQLTQEGVDRIVSLVSSHARPLDDEYEPEVDVPWAQDPAVVAANRSLAARERVIVPEAPMRGSTGAFVSPVELAGHLTGAGDAPSLRGAFVTMGTIVVIVLALGAGVAFLPQLQAGAIAVWTAALVVLVAIAELVAASISAVPRRDGTSRRRSAGRIIGGFLVRLVVVSAFVGGMWVLVAGGGAQTFGEKIASQFQPAMQAVVLPKNTGPSVEVARKTLLQRYPEAFKMVSDVDKPVVDKLANGRVTYTWQYTGGAGSFTLTLDSAGRMVSGKESQ